MPMIQVHYPEGGVTPAQREAITDRLTQVLLQIEGGADTPQGRSIAWVQWFERPAGQWAIGGRTDTTHEAPGGKLLLVVTVPEGSLSRERKRQIHRQVHNEVLQALGVPADAPLAGATHWIIINEVTDGNWGAGGRTIGVLSIAKLVGLDDAHPIAARARQYIAAKLAWLKSAGLPE